MYQFIFFLSLSSTSGDNFSSAHTDFLANFTHDCRSAIKDHPMGDPNTENSDSWLLAVDTFTCRFVLLPFQLIAFSAMGQDTLVAE
ncbi:hypothetical protein TNIN_72321 [Trichonephila inaurata madagascariensis]|uniref:Uncharacterized protein n=1 Tax=Trichonephila inaurata madagascariensis TaxID=2747483 RepID=A0A8X6YUK1_9ARAC|nr:hypothetical protein TNIN_72321 [Trichonephila inaurata madagascariensis]